MPPFDHEFGSSTRAQVDRELLGQAVKEALRKAEALAAGFGKRVGEVRAVSMTPLKNLGNAMGLVPSDFRSSPTPRPKERSEPIGIDLLKLAQSVDVIVRIKCAGAPRI
ncbi:MAG: SIMPL domain-containing protein [Pseudomonadota bacterium]